MAKKRRRLFYFISQYIGMPLAYLYLRLLWPTLRLRYYHLSRLRKLYEEGRQVIFAFWHCDLPLATLLGKAEQKWRNICIITSLSQDGQLISQLLKFFGFGIVRGSSSRGGLHGIINLKKAMDNGYNAAVAVDGPRGPRFEVKSGVLWLAKVTGAALVPVRVRTYSKLQLKSWDRCEVPLPFSKCEVVFGEPLFLNKSSETELESTRKSLQSWLTEIKQQPSKK